jgi:hypothetical protein
MSVDKTPVIPVVYCDADLKDGRKIKVEHGNGVFLFKITKARKSRNIKMLEDEAWIFMKILSAMHPDIKGSSDPLWHQIQKQRKIMAERLEAQS